MTKIDFHSAFIVWIVVDFNLDNLLEILFISFSHIKYHYLVSSWQMISFTLFQLESCIGISIQFSFVLISSTCNSTSTASASSNCKYLTERAMDDIQSIHTRAYSKSTDFVEKITPLQRAVTLGKALPSLIVKTLIVHFAAIYYLLLSLYHYFVPRPLKDIRGQLAAVSKWIEPTSLKIKLSFEYTKCCSLGDWRW